MKNYKKLLLPAVICATVSCAAQVSAVDLTKGSVSSDIDLKLLGYTHFQTGIRQQKHLSPSERYLSSAHKGFAFYGDSAFVVHAAKKMDDFDYGAKIVLVPTAKKKGGKYNGSHLFIETEFGRFEAGSPNEAANNMSVFGADASVESGDWDRYANFEVEDMRVGGLYPSFATSPDFFLDQKLSTKLKDRPYSNEPSRRISYYTPKYNLATSTAVQLGISYTPDSSNTGADSHSSNSSGNFTKKVTKDGKSRFEFDTTVVDALSGGITLDQDISEGAALKLAATGEFGKSKGKAVEFRNNVEVNKHALSDLRSYNLGAVLSLGNFSYGVSFGSLGKSLTTGAFHKRDRKTNYYSTSALYTQGPFGASLSYFKSTQYKNTLDSITLATEFNIAKGLKSYVEASSFKAKGATEFLPDAPKKKSSGVVGLLGIKLSF